MQRIARKYEAELHLDHGEVAGQLRTPEPTPASLWSEAVNDGNGFVMAVLDLPFRALTGCLSQLRPKTPELSLAACAPGRDNVRKFDQ